MPKMKVRKVPSNYRIMGRNIVVPDYGVKPVQDKKGNWTKHKKVLNGYKILGSLHGKRTRA